MPPMSPSCYIFKTHKNIVSPAPFLYLISLICKPVKIYSWFNKGRGVCVCMICYNVRKKAKLIFAMIIKLQEKISNLTVNTGSGQQ